MELILAGLEPVGLGKSRVGDGSVCWCGWVKLFKAGGLELFRADWSWVSDVLAAGLELLRGWG